MSAQPKLKSLSKSEHVGPVDWRRLVEWLLADGVIADDEAQRTPSRPKRAMLAERAEIIQTRWGLPATKWLRGFKPLID